jgi:hypothetical protein
VTVITLIPCTCFKTKRSAGSAPIARAARARFSITASRASPVASPQLSVAYGPDETPPRQLRPVGAREAERLEEPAHPVRLGEPPPGGEQGRRLSRPLSAGEPIETLKEPEPGEEEPLRDRSADDRAGSLGRERERLEIDMRGEIGAAGIRERIGRPPAAQGLEALARRARRRPVIDEERGPRARPEPCAEE